MANVIEETRQLHNDIKTAIIDMGGSLGECSSPKDYPDAIRSIPSIGGNYVTREELEAALKNVSTCNCSDEKFIKILNDWWDEKQNSGSTDEDYLRLSVKELEVFSDLGESKTVTVTSTNRFSYQVSHSWINVSVSNQAVTISCPKYTGTEERTGSVSFYIGNKLYETLIIKQKSASVREEESEINVSLSVSKTNVVLYSTATVLERTIAVIINPGYTFGIKCIGDINASVSDNKIIIDKAEENVSGFIEVYCKEYPSVNKTITVKINKASEIVSADDADIEHFIVTGTIGYPSLQGSATNIWGLEKHEYENRIRPGDGTLYGDRYADALTLYSKCDWICKIDKIYSDVDIEGKNPEEYISFDGTILEKMSGSATEEQEYIKIAPIINTYREVVKIDLAFYTKELKHLKTITIVVMPQYGILFSKAKSKNSDGSVSHYWMREGCNPLATKIYGYDISAFVQGENYYELRFYVTSVNNFKFTNIPEWTDIYITDSNTGDVTELVTIDNVLQPETYFTVRVKDSYLKQLPIKTLSNITVKLIDPVEEYVIDEMSFKVWGATNRTDAQKEYFYV